MADLAGFRGRVIWSTAPAGPTAIMEKSPNRSCARPFIAGEPIREQKLVKANGSGFYGSDPADRHAGDLDRDLAGTRRRRLHPAQRPRRTSFLSKRGEKNPDSKGPDAVQSEIILSNIRVLAIDQAPKEKEGSNSLVGRTATARIEA